MAKFSDCKCLQYWIIYKRFNPDRVTKVQRNPASHFCVFFPAYQYNIWIKFVVQFLYKLNKVLSAPLFFGSLDPIANAMLSAFPFGRFYAADFKIASEKFKVGLSSWMVMLFN